MKIEPTIWLVYKPFTYPREIYYEGIDYEDCLNNCPDGYTVEGISEDSLDAWMNYKPE